tara:strand:+ start:866 stop:1537 length:672 start_codon:yes stop_codon:yes gene_type:complete
MKILIYAAHPDDEAFGCAGAILRHVRKKDKVYVVFFTNGEGSRKNLSKKFLEKQINRRKNQSTLVAKKLGIKKTFYENFDDNELDKNSLLTLVRVAEKYKAIIKPDIVYTHFFNDLNIDHKLVSKAVITAYRPNNRENCKQIYFFEILSNTNLSIGKHLFLPNYFIDISKYINKKLSICKIYKNEIKKKQGRSLKDIKNLAEHRGSQSNFKFAEAFQIHKIYN